MANAIHCVSIVHEEFFKPLLEDLASSKHIRSCPVLNDAFWVESGIRRCLGHFQSGRDFLQNLADSHETQIHVSTFFESLKSKRRCKLLHELLIKSCQRMRSLMPDPYACYESLSDFDIYAGDGHFISAACHDKSAEPAKPQSTTREKPIKYPTGHLYTIDLRSHAMSHLTVADQITRNKEHEMRSLKRQDIETLRQGAEKGRKVLYVWDRAGIDFRQWFQRKSKGVYFLSREKDNMKLEVIGLNHVERTDPINRGVIADEMVASNQGVALRRITWRNKVNNTTYIYLTNLSANVPPGLVAQLYKSRWDIEKVFDEFKNKLLEDKAWASTATAKTNQALLQCLTHNLLTMFEEKIRKQEGLRNEKEFKRRAVREGKSPLETGSKSKPQKENMQQTVERLSQRTVKFIRWLRNHLDVKRSWSQAMARLVEVYTCS